MAASEPLLFPEELEEVKEEDEPDPALRDPALRVATALSEEEEE
eukprot:CAMPEP_0184649672 /NCGR_PEP_ID=MMETSP0308-20130426/7073_1 /TAXON_ID=38269 /ORGANISM="Gloeochaete witrockiana, Strain SAG 46.84" /LENGTH=43 /DNA_ID= /DNA_START= /DNA_END= /DNA_ORIENTATION=